MADEFGYVMNIYHNSAQNVRRKMGTIDNNEMLYNIYEKSGTSNLMNYRKIISLSKLSRCRWMVL